MNMLKRSIILVGLMGAGKSIIGKRLARELGVSFFDSDEEIVLQEKRSIADIFSQNGEEYFRNLEREVIERLLSAEPIVIATGGGAFLKAETRSIINKLGTSIWLRVDAKILATRLFAQEELKKRPLIREIKSLIDLELKLEQLIKERSVSYCQAHIAIDAGRKSKTIVSELIENYLIKPAQNSVARAVVVGETIRYSWSPFIHSYWLKKYDIQGTYHLIEVSQNKFPTLIKFLQATNYRGCNIAMPFKQKAFTLVNNTNDFAQSVGAINTIDIKKGTLNGQNTDAYGFIQSIRQSEEGHSFDFRGKTAVVLGAGGGSRGVCGGLLGEKIGKIILINRTLSHAKEVQTVFGSTIEVMSWDEVNLEKALKKADILINTTSLGMTGKEPLEIDLFHLSSTALVVDIVYKPVITPLLENAKKRGNPIVDGLGMLLHQAVPGFEAWFGLRPEVTPALRQHIIDITSQGFLKLGEFLVPTALYHSRKNINNEDVMIPKHPIKYAKDDIQIRYKTSQSLYSLFKIRKAGLDNQSKEFHYLPSKQSP